ncbi:40971_t:CDS:2 [Gigaspora margarita]|uniref:40971_t:CDS:1 n=1 Tax=Gigaspora margarita TaxID=4874 RepID=A0ABN7UKL3_GIGMA|nr:40971_t:CDS:2 [Gigaspora margarita]
MLIGSCDSTGGHLDLYGVGNATGYVCDPNTPDKCEAGDLSRTPNSKVTAENADPYISLNGTTTLENGVIGRAVVIHQTYALHQELLVLILLKETVRKVWRLLNN